MGKNNLRQPWGANLGLDNTTKPVSQAVSLDVPADHSREIPPDRLDIYLVSRGRKQYIQISETGLFIEWSPKKMSLDLIQELFWLWNKLGTHLFANSSGYVDWVFTKNKQLENQSPFAYVNQTRNLTNVEALLGRMVYGVMA